MPHKPQKQPDMPPNFPQHEFPQPYARLLTLGEEAVLADYDEIAAELQKGDVRAAAAQLVEMALDKTYYEYEGEDDSRSWTRLHALMVLRRLGEAAQVAIEPLLPLLGDEDDWLREEMPYVYAEMGAPAIEPLTRTLLNPETGTYTRSGAGDSLQEMAEAHPELRDQIVPILEQALMAEKREPELAGFLVCNLMDLGSRESLPLIEQAFQEGRVDEDIIDMSDVEDHFERLEQGPLPGGALFPNWMDETEEEDPEEEIAAAHGMSREENVPYVAPYKVGRNDPCPCGSGKKYKKCCGAGK
ncbi:MAG TPA: DUF1186 domain-containing protein [Chthonomonadaceae bacterium]|nr:DUF1186 domain-containing protein [Chthonomonadaceae bacterium]